MSFTRIPEIARMFAVSLNNSDGILVAVKFYSVRKQSGERKKKNDPRDERSAKVIGTGMKGEAVLMKENTTRRDRE